MDNVSLVMMVSPVHLAITNSGTFPLQIPLWDQHEGVITGTVPVVHRHMIRQTRPGLVYMHNKWTALSRFLQQIIAVIQSLPYHHESFP